MLLMDNTSNILGVTSDLLFTNMIRHLFSLLLFFVAVVVAVVVFWGFFLTEIISHQTHICSNSTIETLEKGVVYVQSSQ